MHLSTETANVERELETCYNTFNYQLPPAGRLYT